MISLLIRLRRIAWLVSVVLVLSKTSSAQNTALIIGNDDYEPGNGWIDLPGVIPDTNDMDGALTNAGWTTVVIRNKTAAEITAAITANIPPKGKKYLVYYAGHGNNLAGDEGELAGVDDSKVTPAAFVAALGAAASRTMVILDSCGGGEFSDQVNALSNAIGFLTSTTDLQCAGKGGAGGFFTQCLVDGLNGLADANNDGDITVAEAAAYVLANCVFTGQTPTWDGDHGSCVIGETVETTCVPALPEWGSALLVLLTAGVGFVLVGRNSEAMPVR